MRTTVAILLAAALLTSGCAQMITMTRADIVPAAMAEAKASRDGNQNPIIDLKVQKLAPAQNLKPAQKTYVVWAEGRDGKFHLLGRLAIDDDGEGSFQGRPPIEELRLVVTAEPGPAPSAPSQQKVLSSGFFTVKK